MPRFIVMFINEDYEEVDLEVSALDAEHAEDVVHKQHEMGTIIEVVQVKEELCC